MQTHQLKDVMLIAGLQVWAANGMGKIECLDLRMNKMQGSLKGAAGAVRSMALHPQLPIMASVGLDRFLRLHNVESKQLLCKLYLKLQLTNVAWADVPMQENLVHEGSDGAVEPALTVDDQENHVHQIAEEKTKQSEGSNGKRSGSHKGKSKKKKQRVTEPS